MVLKDLNDTKSVAEFLDVTQGHLKNLRTKGGGPHYRKIGPRLVRYPREEVLAWVEGMKLVASTAEADAASSVCRKTTDDERAAQAAKAVSE